MIIVQYGLTGNNRPWDGAPGFYHFARIESDTRYVSYTKPEYGYGKRWHEKGVSHLTKFRLELVY